MDFRRERLSIEEAKEMDMVNYLSSLGHEPLKLRNNDYWYLSPLRDEKTPSFKVNRKLNRWYDHGLGNGGNLIDFGIEYHRCTISELLENLSGNFSLQQPVIVPKNSEIDGYQKINILNETELSSTALLRYLEQRKIPLEIAEKYCREVRYELGDKSYFGIGFKNDSGGFEIRNPYIKLSSSPKDITSIKNDSGEVAVFEGFMDFLSFKAVHKNRPEDAQNFIVLNSISFFEKARPFMEELQSIRLYLDNDTAGNNVTQRALELSPKYTDERSLYKNHKDLNEWLASSEKIQRKHQGQRMR